MRSERPAWQASRGADLACADARVSPNWVFDMGPGDLFEVRSACNTAFDAGIASLEYAVAELGVPLLEELVTPIRASLVLGDDLTQVIAANARQAVAVDKLRIQPLLFALDTGLVRLI